jgi:hypothetical protein
MSPTEHPDAVAEVTTLFERYERDLVANDVDAMDAAFWDDPRVVRYGIAEVQVGMDAIRTWRRTATPVPATRRVTSRHVLALAQDVPPSFPVREQSLTAHCSVRVRQMTCRVPDRQIIETWRRIDGAWRIVRAHVSII